MNQNVSQNDNVRVPVAKVRSVVSEEEWQVRVDLAACYRLMVKYGMTDLIYNHITAKVPGAPNHFLINAYGLHYSEICASNLVEVDLDGNELLRPVMPEGEFGLLPAGYVIHSSVHRAKEKVGCVIHTHTRAGMAVSAMDCGLLPLTQNSMKFQGALSYHDYGMPARDEEGARMVESLGNNHYMVLRNHGLLACGRTVAEAFLGMYWLELACKVQVDALSSGVKLTQPAPEVLPDMAKRYRVMPGTLEWGAMIRMLDREDPSYRN
jgi:ribulose-5-phosphate 4-epimerase/fuculose-1-phosphate aldolase